MFWKYYGNFIQDRVTATNIERQLLVRSFGYSNITEAVIKLYLKYGTVSEVVRKLKYNGVNTVYKKLRKFNIPTKHVVKKLYIKNTSCDQFTPDDWQRLESTISWNYQADRKHIAISLGYNTISEAIYDLYIKFGPRYTGYLFEYTKERIQSFARTNGFSNSQRGCNVYNRPGMKGVQLGVISPVTSCVISNVDLIRYTDELIIFIKELNRGCSISLISSCSCPLCNQLLDYVVRADNGNTAGTCRTNGCLQWRE